LPRWTGFVINTHGAGSAHPAEAAAVAPAERGGVDIVPVDVG
jgi:hypothetical protein